MPFLHCRTVPHSVVLLLLLCTVMYSAEEIGQPVYGRVAPHPAHWGHAALVGRCTAAVLACAPAAVRAALGRHRVLHRYTAHYDAAAACLVIAVPDDDNGDSNGTTLAGALDAPAHVPALCVLAVEPVGGSSAAAPRRVLACPCGDPTAAPVTLACTGRLSPLVVCSPLLSCLPLWWSLLGMHTHTPTDPREHRRRRCGTDAVAAEARRGRRDGCGCRGAALPVAA